MMRLLLMLADEAQRTVCSDFYAACGCDVQLACNPAEAQPLLRFREYDLLIADLPPAGKAQAELIRLVCHQRGTALSVLLTTGNAEPDITSDSIVTLTKPQPLEPILAAGLAHAAARCRREARAGTLQARL